MLLNLFILNTEGNLLYMLRHINDVVTAHFAELEHQAMARNLDQRQQWAVLF